MTVSEKWLVALADPEDSHLNNLPRPKLQAEELLPMCLHAELHGILPVVLRNVESLLRQTPDEILFLPARREEALAALRPLQKRLAEKAVIVLFLEAEFRKITRELQISGAPVIPLKGADFASRLYTPSTLRSFGDVDLLVRTGDRDRVSVVMSRLGYVPKETPMKYTTGYSEQTWEHAAVPGASVEIHDNLVNSPTIRRGVSVKFEDVLVESTPHGAIRPTPAGLLIIAAVHGAASHSFDKLQHLCDITQIARGRAGPIDEESLCESLAKTQAGFSVALGLDLAGRTFNEPAATNLLARLKLRWPRQITRLLITPALVARSQGKRRPGASWRRQTLRQMLKSRH
jgi:hypothetical protein